MKKNDIDSFYENGFLFKKNLFDSETCENIINYLNSKKSAIDIPYSSTPWGYGNLLNDTKLALIQNNSFIKDFCKTVLGDLFVFNHLMINNKASFIGPAVEWHREVFNVNTFAPGSIENNSSWQNFLQIYVALDKHTIDNGCLKIVPKSHLIETIDPEDMVNDRFVHKRKISQKDMKEIVSKLGLKNVSMEPGDTLIFNHKIIHGSGTNLSPYERKSIVMQARLPFARDEKVFQFESSYRSNFVLNELLKKIEKIKGKNIYNDFKKD